MLYLINFYLATDCGLKENIKKLINFIKFFFDQKIKSYITAYNNLFFLINLKNLTFYIFFHSLFPYKLFKKKTEENFNRIFFNVTIFHVIIC